MQTRCPWALHSPLETTYHDMEWGSPVFDDRKLFEFLLLETAQAGLSWLTILQKRPGYRAAFAQFNPEAVALFTGHDVEKLMQNPAIVRNRRKIESAVTNAKAFLSIQEQFGSFSKYIWDFVDGEPIINHWTTLEEVPPLTPLSTRMAKELKKHGFAFVGSTTIYAFMQAVGMVNDHLVSCFRHQAVQHQDIHK